MSEQNIGTGQEQIDTEETENYSHDEEQFKPEDSNEQKVDEKYIDTIWPSIIQEFKSNNISKQIFVQATNSYVENVCHKGDSVTMMMNGLNSYPFISVEAVDQSIDESTSVEQNREPNSNSDDSTENIPQERIKLLEKLGENILHLRIGSWSHPSSYPTQMRMQVDMKNRCITLVLSEYLRDMNDEPAGQEQVKQYLTEQADKYAKSRLLRMIIPFDSITGVHYHVSESMHFGLFILQLDNAPSFAQTSVISEQWHPREDFTTNKQANVESKIFAIVSPHTFEKMLKQLLTDSAFANKYNNPMDEPGKRTLYENAQNHKSSSLPSDEPFTTYQAEEPDCIIS